MLVTATIHRELKQHAEPKYLESQQRFFKEGIALYGVRLGTVRRLANQYFRQITPRTKEQVFKLAEELLRSGLQETSVIAFHWADKMTKSFTPSDFTLFERWLKLYVHNWASCDDLVTGPLGELVYRYPILVQRTHRWRYSHNRWLRRASAIVLIVAVRHGVLLPEVFAAADALLTDHDDLVQKGYGWTLKEASRLFPHEVFRFVLARKDRMPRTALRYAIEKLPRAWRKQAMR